MKKRQSVHLAIHEIVKEELQIQEIGIHKFISDLGFSQNFKRDLTSPKITFDRVAEVADYLRIDGADLIEAYLIEKRKGKR